MRRGVSLATALDAVWGSTMRGRCPACRATSMFSGWIDVHDSCPHCGIVYQTESGAWLGTMAIGYAVGALVAVALTVSEVLWHAISRTGLDPTVVIAVLALAASALTYRQAKGFWFALLWLYEFTGEPE